MARYEFEYRTTSGSIGVSYDPGSVSSFLPTLVSAAFGVRPDSLCGGQRARADVAFARQVVMYLAHTRFRFSYAAAGRLVGRDRTTARHACFLVEERREEPRIDSLIDYLETLIDGWPCQAAPLGLAS